MQNIEINNANGKFFGGEYESVSVNGTAKCDGDIVCKSMDVNGVLKANSVHADSLGDNGVLKADGNITAGCADVNGMLNVTGDLISNALDINGNVSVDGNVSAETTDIAGRLKCDGTAALGKCDCTGMVQVGNGLTATELDIDGMLKVTGNIEAEKIETNGYISSTAQISADNIEISGFVRADEIVGDRIEIDFKGPAEFTAKLINSLFGSHLRNETKCANLIEATTIELTGVNAGVVSGENVYIGENCHIDRLDCTGTYTIDPSSTVRILNSNPYNG